MIDPTLLAALTGIIGAILAAIWSFLMAAKVAAPRAAAKSKALIIGILTGETKEDQMILESIRASLVRPEIEKMMASPPEFEIDADAMADRLYAKIQGEKGTAMKALQEELQNKFDGPLNELSESLMDGARMAQSPMDIALMRLLNVELTPKFKKMYPDKAMLIESGKVTIAQLAEIARHSGLLNRASEGAAIESASGWNPGVRR